MVKLDLYSVRMLNNIAVALIGAIGDVVLSTPLLQALRSTYPAARITFLVGRKSAPVLNGINCVDEIILIEDDPNPSFSSTATLLNEVRRGQFDVVICLSRSDRLSLVFWLARIPRRIGFTPLRTDYLLTDHICSSDEPQNSAHRTRYFLAAAEVLGIPQPSVLKLQYCLSDDERLAAQQRLQIAGINPASQTVVGIHPGTSRISMEKRRWAAANFVETARQMAVRGHRIVLFGGPDEVADCRSIALSLGNAVIDFSGKLQLREFAAVLQHCHLLIHHDSSPLHLAGALGVPVVAIFGYQNPKQWGPLDDKSQVVRLDLPCSPCDQDFVCDRAFECVRSLPVSSVVEAAERILETFSGVRIR